MDHRRSLSKATLLIKFMLKAYACLISTQSDAPVPPDAVNEG